MTTSAHDPTDKPGVVVLPPVLYSVAFIVAFLLRWWMPLPIFGSAIAIWIGAASFVAGLAIGIPARRALSAAGTNVNPMQPTTAIVSAGPYGFTRNPLYVSMILLFLGVTTAFDTWWGPIVLLPVLPVMHFGVILREERYLERKFGEAYRQYRAKVRRYL